MTQANHVSPSWQPRARYVYATNARRSVAHLVRPGAAGPPFSAVCGSALYCPQRALTATAEARICHVCRWYAFHVERRSA
jgi:hypothetical protein